ncbi:Uncharacterised protein [Staphylococcus aureus]|nr:Uncharacterised protein [Staphylococcus aureus]
MKNNNISTINDKLPMLSITYFTTLGGSFFNLNGGHKKAKITPSNNVCNLVSVPKYTRE